MFYCSNNAYSSSGYKKGLYKEFELTCAGVAKVIIPAGFTEKVTIFKDVPLPPKIEYIDSKDNNILLVPLWGCEQTFFYTDTDSLNVVKSELRLLSKNGPLDYNAIKRAKGNQSIIFYTIIKNKQGINKFIGAVSMRGVMFYVISKSKDADFLEDFSVGFLKSINLQKE